ncbi:MAG TPA: hypothetical protein VF989_03440 [Polyangiaceae bacterium]
MLDSASASPGEHATPREQQCRVLGIAAAARRGARGSATSSRAAKITVVR